MIIKNVFSLALLALLAESRVVFRAPDVLEVNSQLFIVDEGAEDELRMALDEMIKEGKGNFTPWLNFDHADIMKGSTGDYEWLRQIRTKEGNYGDCIVPCDDADILAMEVDIIGTEKDQTIMEDCIELLPESRRPTVGFFCMNYDQRRRNSKCRKNPQCQEYMTEHCMCPDFEVRYFCRGTEDQFDQFCKSREEHFLAKLNSRKRSYDGLVESLKKADGEAGLVARSDIEDELNEEESKTVEKEGKVQSMLRELIDALAKEQK